MLQRVPSQLALAARAVSGRRDWSHGPASSLLICACTAQPGVPWSAVGWHCSAPFSRVAGAWGYSVARLTARSVARACCTG